MTTESLRLSTPCPAQARSVRERVLATLGLWRRRSRERRALAQLSPWALHDLGVSNAEVWAEIHKAPWRG
jgi:uncharacterized protein YjiS (DUF1127 family)